jgi:hypothetical protein
MGDLRAPSYVVHKRARRRTITGLDIVDVSSENVQPSDREMHPSVFSICRGGWHG